MLNKIKMNIKYALISAIVLTLIILLFSVYKIMFYVNNKTSSKRYTLRRRNALTEEQFNKILKKLNKPKNLN
jgi:type IV secretory pathway VirB6-like protein